jgi:hypothetical protein
MKAIIKIVTARKDFRPDQIAIMRRVSMVLQEHDLSVDIRISKKVMKEIPILRLNTG